MQEHNLASFKILICSGQMTSSKAVAPCSEYIQVPSTLVHSSANEASMCCRFNFTKWAVSLNDMPEGLDRILPPSDMRWRKDVRLLEQGRYEEVLPCSTESL